MKKIILSFVLLLTTTLSYSQLFNVGIKAGYNSSLSFSSIGSGIHYTPSNALKEFGNNFHVGVFGRLYFKNLYLQPEVLYSKQEKQYTYEENGNISPSNMVRFSTVDVPVLLGYRLLNLRVINIRAFAGPKFRFNAGSKANFSSPEEIIASTAKVGLDVGIGIDVLMFTLDVRYGLIGNLYNIPNEVQNGLTPSTFLFSLGWKIL